MLFRSTYFDIVKNYYANTQEENFYMIGNTEELKITINEKQVNPNVIPSNEGRINNTGMITISPNTIKENEIQIKVSKNSPTGQSVILAPGDIGISGVEGETIKIITNKVPTGETWYIRSIQTINKITLESYPLENLDISDPNKSVAPLKNFAKRTSDGRLNTSNTQYGLCLKTYNSVVR